MNAYLRSLLPRLKQAGRTLDDLARLEEQPWVQVTGGARTVYVFRPGGGLLVSREGDVETATWEHVPALQSVVVSAGGTKTLYNHGYLDDAVLALRKDGTDEYLLLANQAKIGDVTEENVLRYLRGRYDAQAGRLRLGAGDPGTDGGRAGETTGQLHAVAEAHAVGARPGTEAEGSVQDKHSFMSFAVSVIIVLISVGVIIALLPEATRTSSDLGPVERVESYPYRAPPAPQEGNPYLRPNRLPPRSNPYTNSPAADGTPKNPFLQPSRLPPGSFSPRPVYGPDGSD